MTKYILHFETATNNCSVALSANGMLLAVKEDNSKGYSHAALLTVITEEVLKSQKISFDKLSAVCVNKGPGSYTGLRIGVSAAKGICYAKDIPLIAVDSLFSLASLCVEEHKNIIKEHAGEGDYYLCPMIDARRMEVYSAIYDDKLCTLKAIDAEIIDKSSFKELINEKPFFIFGNGAEKCTDVLSHQNLHLIPNVESSSKGLIAPGYKKFLNKTFEDVAYFEPFYLKDFVAGKPKVKGLR